MDLLAQTKSRYSSRGIYHTWYIRLLGEILPLKPWFNSNAPYLNPSPRLIRNSGAKWNGYTSRTALVCSLRDRPKFPLDSQRCMKE